jgi:hypothetical protein
MKLTIWQQFSSNHSNGFTVVGQFATQGDAKKAATRLTKILEGIYLQSIGYVDAEPVQAELDVSKEFNIKWSEHLDWIDTDSWNHVLQFDEYIAVSDYHGNTWKGNLYIDEIISKLGGKVHIEDDRFVITVELKCHLTDPERMKSLAKILNNYFIEVRAERSHLIDSPWKSIADRLSNFDKSRPSDDAWYGYVDVDGDKLQFSRLKFSSIGCGLPALLEFLKEAGCIDIEYSISQRPMNEVYRNENNDPNR